MTKKETIRTILILSLISACIYGLQILIFHDLRDTEFYILQDLAFIPISVAITTVVVGNIISDRDQKEAREKAGMLRAAFFTIAGSQLMQLLTRCSNISDDTCMHDTSDVMVQADQNTCESIQKLLEEKQQALIAMTGNSSLMEQEDFTQLLGGIFHLLDEFHLRGSWSQMSDQDHSHMNEDFAKVLILLETNRMENAHFQQKYFPDFYKTSLAKKKTN